MTVLISETTPAIQLPDADDLVVPPSTDQPVTSIKVLAATDREHLSFLGQVSPIRWWT